MDVWIYLGFFIALQILIYLFKKIFDVITIIKLQKKLNKIAPKIEDLDVKSFVRINEEISTKKEEIFSKITILSRYSPSIYFHYFPQKQEETSIWNFINADTYAQQNRTNKENSVGKFRGMRK